MYEILLLFFFYNRTIFTKEMYTLKCLSPRFLSAHIIDKMVETNFLNCIAYRRNVEPAQAALPAEECPGKVGQESCREGGVDDRKTELFVV